MSIPLSTVAAFGASLLLSGTLLAGSAMTRAPTQPGVLGIRGEAAAWAFEADDVQDVSTSESAPSPQGEATGAETTGAETSVSSDYVPIGLGMAQRSPWRIKGYYRSEYKFHRPNLYYGFDDRLGLWTPRGSPYAAFGLMPVVDHEAYAELNFEVSWRALGFLSLYTDTSFVFSTVRLEQSMFEQAQDALIGMGRVSPITDVSEFDMGDPIPGTSIEGFVRASQERIQLNELYATLNLGDWVSMTLGKRRIVWGSAFTWAPMDVVNPPFNALEPTLLREGSYNVVADLVHFDSFVFTALYRPKVTENARGLPTDWDFTSNLFAGRFYLNLWDSDINLVGYYDRGRVYGALSFSRYFNLVEIHTETLLQRGRPTWLVRPTTPPSDADANLYAPFELGQFGLDGCQGGGACGISADILVGTRYAFGDDSILLAEYLYHGPGYNSVEYDNYLAFTAYMEEALPHVATELSSSEGSVSDSVLQSWEDMLIRSPLVYQEITVRHHYLGVSFLKSKMFELVEPKLTAIWNLDDLSLILYPSVDFVLAPGSQGRGTVKFMAGFLAFLGTPGSQVYVYPTRYTANLRLTTRF